MKAFLKLRPKFVTPHLFILLAMLAPATLRAQCTPAPAGLVSWWQGEGNANDIIGGNNGTLIGNTGYASGEVGQAFVSDGNGDCVMVGNPTNLQLQNFTIEVWIKRSSSSIVSYGGFGNGIIFGYGQGGYGLYLDANGTPALSAIGIGETKPGISISDTNFHHLAVTKAGSTVVFYVDGIAYSAPAYDPGFVFTTVAAIGARGDILDNSFFGCIDEVSFYSRALSSNEIAAIYNASSAGKCVSTMDGCTAPPAGLVSWWAGENNLFDRVGTNNGSVIGNLAYTNAEVGQGFYFDGGANRIIVPDAPELNFGSNQDFSIEAWIRPEVAPTDYGIMSIVDKRIASSVVDSPNGYEFSLSDGKIHCRLMSTGFGPAGPDMRDGLLHHIAMTLSRNSTNGGNLYVDGVAVFTFDATALNGSLVNDQPLRIGNHASAEVNSFFKGIIDEVSIYNRALASNEISAIYNAGSAGKCTAITTASPIIYSQPTDQAALTNSTATFTVIAGGTMPLYYQWYFNSTPLTNSGHIGGSTTASLNISNTLPADAGDYTVVITNSWGAITSSVAKLAIVIVPTTITLQPQSQTAIVGDNVIFTGGAIGDSPLNYQWYFNGNPLTDNGRITGSGSTNLSISNVQTSDAGNYNLHGQQSGKLHGQHHGGVDSSGAGNHHNATSWTFGAAGLADHIYCRRRRHVCKSSMATEWHQHSGRDRQQLLHCRRGNE
ncbi:MAG: LamG-like jellyroll fold domain-containing protein [Limisphaerales bacterium]